MPLSSNSRGALMMTIAMGAFTTNDALIKSITHDLNIAQIIFLRGIATAIILAVMAWSYGILGQFRLMFNKAVILRSGFEIGCWNPPCCIPFSSAENPRSSWAAISSGVMPAMSSALIPAM